MNPAWVTAAIAFAVALGALVTWACRWTWRILTRIVRFLDDYQGEPAHEGLPARPGVMARLQAVEDMLRDVRAETRPNDGYSMRDVIHQIREDVSDVKADQAAMRAQIEQIQGSRERRERQR